MKLIFFSRLAIYRRADLPSVVWCILINARFSFFRRFHLFLCRAAFSFLINPVPNSSISFEKQENCFVLAERMKKMERMDHAENLCDKDEVSTVVRFCTLVCQRLRLLFPHLFSLRVVYHANIHNKKSIINHVAYLHFTLKYFCYFSKYIYIFIKIKILLK